MTTLKELRIEDREEQKYATRCPQCADSRRKSSTQSLMVYRDEDGIRYECLHNDCPWFENRQFIPTNQKEFKENKIEFKIPIPEMAGEPPLHSGPLYEYLDIDNNRLFYILRFDDPQGKRFIPLSYTTSGEWIAKKPPIKALYGAENLKGNPSRTVIVVEGEKAKDAGQKIFSTAVVVSWPGGVGGIKTGDWDLLKGRQVVLWPDNDEPGISAMKKIATMIDGNVSIVDVSSLPPKADLADDLTREQIQEVWRTQEECNKPEVTGSYDGTSLTDRLRSIRIGETIGWSNMQYIRLPQSGLVIVEGRTGHGKSTMMVNIMAKKIQMGRSPIIFYSYEMPAERILLKLVMVLDGRILDPIPYINEEKYREECVIGTNEIYNTIVGKLDKEIFITDSYIDFTKLINNLSSPKMRGAIVFIDYIQYIPSTSKEQSRYLVIKEFADKIQNIAHKNKLIVFAGAQLTPGDRPQLDSPREGKDIHNAAELVLRIWNKDVGQTMGVVRQDLEELPGNCAIEVRKNRNGTSGQRYCFNLENGCILKEINSGEF